MSTTKLAKLHGKMPMSAFCCAFATILREQVLDLSDDEDWTCRLFGNSTFTLEDKALAVLTHIAFQHGKTLAAISEEGDDPFFGEMWLTDSDSRPPSHSGRQRDREP